MAVGLVDRARRGDAEAFAQLFQLRVDGVRRYVTRILRGGPAAEDATAETFLRAWERLPTLREPRRFDAWLFRIAHHVAIDELRRLPQAPLVDAEQVPDAAAHADPARMMGISADNVRLRDALLALPERQREVLILRYFADRDDAEVAALLGTSLGNVRVIRSRAMARLRELLEPNEQAS